ncbi:hypothetical protein KC19_6G117200 [Ceratodon purpureus]|uniref:F-actin-capping protein subunit beta n=1 Tax=Ceratodon purpureus TaxID=3225 RepID=A0A8T0HE12_CERPU|nr:hypothetical protein KC19_6G117200 [Ceratodon purpureus]KAG0569793.1 hypothetical protein KC19_6G117200 [Ceratodon purpureus]KAG0569794.1 hypothetical protein KC19_6G117200 [Ceratodon purpureus]KAG0569795.1 hypothetical protein KC19_6G117200 [Ceratodon purpureus]KAG0569800.1 hypothetical protein KC19_6G117200 [Ceratodon purpureus]
MEAAMDLMRRMPPSLSQQALDSLLALLPAHSSQLLSRSDQPLQVAWDEEFDKDYLLCDYNRDGDSYRSPWSSKYKPELEDGVQPSAELRKLEQEANEVFSIYRDQYYEGGISSVYVWEPEDGKGFAACVLIKKDGSDAGDGRRGLLQEGSWDAIHVIEVKEDEDHQFGHYCLTSTVMLALTTANQSSGPFSLSGSITRQMESDLSIENGHLCNIGRLVEEMESKLRNGLDQVYFGKTKEVVFTLREPLGVMSATSHVGQSLQRMIVNDLGRSR